jgi:LysM repeat protein
MAAEAQDNVHTVRAGETLFSISRQYDVPVQQLRQWNNLPDNTIRPGQRLYIGMDAPDETTSDSDTVDVRETGERLSHVVEPGETLFRISRMYNVTVEQIMDWNNLQDFSISIGQKLTIRGIPGPAQHQERARETDTADAIHPQISAEWDFESSPQGRFIRYTLREEDTVEELLNYHLMDRHEFRALNPGVRISDLQPGDEITLLLTATSSQRNPYRIQAEQKEAGQISVSRYSDDQRGKPTTSGDLYNPESLTAAHPGLPLGTVVFVTNPQTEKGVYVLINDRTTDNRLILSDAAYRALQFTGTDRGIAMIFEDTGQ